MRDFAAFDASLIHPTPEIFDAAKVKSKPFAPFANRPVGAPEPVVLECDGRIPSTEHADRGRVFTSVTLDLIEDLYPESWQSAFPAKGAARLTIDLPRFTQTVVGLKIAVPANAQPGQVIRLHFVQRGLAAKRIFGGVAVQVNVARPGEAQRKPQEQTA